MTADISERPRWELLDLPFTIEVTSTPHNEHPFPDTLPFTLTVKPESGLFVQELNPLVSESLQAAYGRGSLVGNAMDDTPLGAPYAHDFCSYVRRHISLTGISVLEIGAGRGYLAKLLGDAGACVEGAEPGVRNQPFWKRYGVDIRPVMFPDPSLTGPYDLVVAYGVLEHIEIPELFLAQIADVLKPNGKLALSVPDCSEYIRNGDPSMLLHEHFSYFDDATLPRLLNASTFRVSDIQRARHGGALYALAYLGKKVGRADIRFGDLMVSAFSEFVHEAKRKRMKIKEAFSQLHEQKKMLGVYCPARALALLPSGFHGRFFDDSYDVHGKYYPPYGARVESRQDLLKEPVDELWIMSRTFGDEIRQVLAGDRRLADCTVRAVCDDDFFDKRRPC